jgi:serine/threonine protein kinase/tetratricopeptide (TPR) repeat protein
VDDVAWFGRKERRSSPPPDTGALADDAAKGGSEFDGLANLLEPGSEDAADDERTRIQIPSQKPPPARKPPPVPAAPAGTALRRPSPPPLPSRPPGRTDTRPPTAAPAKRTRAPSPRPVTKRDDCVSTMLRDDDEATRIQTPDAPAQPEDDEATRIQTPEAPAGDAEVTRIQTPDAPAGDDEATRIQTPEAPAGDDEATRIQTPEAPAGDDEATRIQTTGSHAVVVGQSLTRPVRREKPSKRKRDAKAKRKTGDEPLPQGTMVGRYLLTQRVGLGGMGSVYAAYDPELDRKVAVKLLHGEPGHGSSGSASRGRLLREAQAMAKLSHPAVVTVHDVGLFGKQVFVAMEFIEGETLREWMRTGKRPWRETLEVFMQAGEGLAAAHAAGLIHRDFKPSNVVISNDGRARVLDFGLARRAEQDEAEPEPDSREVSQSKPPALVSRLEGEFSVSMSGSRSSLDMHLTQAGSIMGSPAYMSPEQHMGRDTDPRSDQFSFCVSLFEALYGERPFISEDHRTLVYAILEQRIRPAPRDSRVPKSIHRAIVRGLAANPTDRYPSMEALLADLRRDPGRSVRRWVASLAIAAVLGAGAFVMWPKEVTDDALAAVDALSTSAREAAAKSLFVYPPANDPDQKTAYSQVLELERLEQEIGRIARTRASELREEFAETLLYLGDRYWDQDGGKPFAIDYYAQALVFDDSNERARERASLTVGELADLRRKANEADFSVHELEAAAPLAALAETDEEKRDERLAALLDSAEETGRSVSSDARLERLLQNKRQEKPRSTPSRTVPAQPGSGAAGVPAAGEDDAQPPAPGERTVTRQKHDPKYARELAKEGQAALQAANWKEAARLFHQALSYDRKCTAALIGLSDLHFEKAERTQAIEYAQRAVAVAAKNAGYRIKLGDAYFKALRYHDAKAEYEAAAKLADKRAKGRLEKIAQVLGE